MTLNVDQIKTRFNKDGYIAIKAFVSGTELEEISDNVARFIREVVPSLPREHVFCEDKDDISTLKQIQQMGVYDSYFNRWMEKSPFRKMAEVLLDGKVVAKNLQFFNKPAGSGKPTPPHQDGYYFMIEPCFALTMWFALDDVDEENGCVRYIPGSHLEGLRPHGRTKTLGFSQGIMDYPWGTDSQRETPIHARAGDLIIHDALSVHRANGNFSAHRSRKALGFIYYSSEARENMQAHESYQQKLKKELIESQEI